MDSVDAYLEELVSLLDCDPLRRDEIRLEVHTHLRELVDAGLRDGCGEDEAVEAAIRRFGSAVDVAGRLNTVPGRTARPGIEWGHPARAIWQTVAAMVLLLTCVTFSQPSRDIGVCLTQFARTGDLQQLDIFGTGTYTGLFAWVCLGLVAATLAWRHARRSQVLWAVAAFALATALPVWILRPLAQYVLWADEGYTAYEFEITQLCYWSLGSAAGVPVVWALAAFLPRMRRWLTSSSPAGTVVLVLALAVAALWASPVGFGFAGGFELVVHPATRETGMQHVVPHHFRQAGWLWQLAKLAGCLVVALASAKLAALWSRSPEARPVRAGLIAAVATVVASPVAALTAQTMHIAGLSLLAASLAQVALVASAAGALAMAGSLRAPGRGLFGVGHEPQTAT